MKTLTSNLSVLTLFVVFLAVLPAAATERMYATVSALYTDVDNAGQSVTGPGYKLGLGYQFHPQWYVETGVQQLTDQNDALNALQIDGLYLSLLGKARNRQGELFYRIGVMRLDLEGLYIPEGTACAAVIPSPCAINETILAGNIGIGFDFFITDRMMLRVEGEYIQGEQDFSSGALTLGLRYNFN